MPTKKAILTPNEQSTLLLALSKAPLDAVSILVMVEKMVQTHVLAAHEEARLLYLIH